MSPDVKISELRGVDGDFPASCPLCGWAGPASNTLGTITSESFWTSDRVLGTLLNTAIRTASGPMVQALEFMGLLPKILQEPTAEVPADRLKLHNTLAQECRDRVMRASLEALIVRALEEASEANRYYQRELAKAPADRSS